MVLVLGRCCENTVLFLTGFKVGIYWEMIIFQKGWGCRKGRESNVKKEVGFFFLSIKTFVPVSRDTTHKDRSLDLNECFVVLNTMN